MENKIEIYQTTENKTEIRVLFEDETVWLNRHQMAELRGRDQCLPAGIGSNIQPHLFYPLKNFCKKPFFLLPSSRMEMSPSIENPSKM